MVKVLGGAVRNLFDIEADDPDDFTRDIAEGLYEALRAAAAETPQKSRSGPSGWAKFNAAKKNKKAKQDEIQVKRVTRLRIAGKAKEPES